MTQSTTLVPVVGTGAAAAMIFNILPVFLGSAAESFGLDESAAGWLATTYLAGFGLSSVSAALWLHRLGRKTLALALFFTAACLLMLASMMQAYTAVVGTLFAAGLVLGGLYTFSFMLAAEHADTTRAVGIKLGGEVALGALLLAIIPTIVYPMFGFSGLLVTLAIVLLAISPCTRWLRAGALPIGSQAISSQAISDGAGPKLLPSAFVLGALFLFTVGQASVWSFVERAGARAGFEAAAIGGVLSVAVLLGGIGSFLAGALSDRWGKVVPLLMAASLYLAAMALFTFGTQYWVYALAINLFFFAWLFALPYFISVIAGIDDSGRATSLVTACLAFGSMLGPAIAGELLTLGGFPLLYLSGAICSCAAYACAIAMARR